MLRNCFTLALDGKISLDFNIEKPHTTGLQDWVGFYEIGIILLFFKLLFIYFREMYE